MGLFDIGKNLIRNLTQTEITNEMIQNAKAELALEDVLMENEFVKVLLTNDYPKLIYGSQYLANESDTRKKFSIENEERIIAYIRSTDVGVNVFATENLVITDKAIYSSSDKYQKRIPFNDIVKYIVVSDGKGQGTENISYIKLRSPEKSFFVMSKNVTMGFSGIPEKSMLRLLLDIQALSADSDERKGVLGWAADYVNTNTNDGIISFDARTLIEGLRMSDEADDSMLDALVVSAIKSCSTDSMMRFVARTYDGYEHYKTIIDEEISRLFTRIATTPDDKAFREKCKEAIEKKADDVELSDEQESLLYYYDDALGKITSIITALSDMCVSMGTISRWADMYFNDGKKVTRIENADNPSENELVNLASCTEKDLFISMSVKQKNKILSGVYARIKENSEIRKEEYQYVDGMGFTPLHYAFMLHNKELPKKIIGTIKSTSVAFEDMPEEILQLLDYKVWAAYVMKDEILDSLLEKTDEILVLRKTQAHLKRLLMASKGIAVVEDMIISSGKSAARDAKRTGDYDRYENLNSRASNLDDKLDLAKEKIKEYRNEIEEIENEINEAKSRLRLECKNNSKSIFDDEGMGLFIADIIKNEGRYERVIKSEDDSLEIFCYYGVWFYSNKEFSFWKQNDNRRKNADEGKESSKNGRDGKKWFSDEAYKDISVMTSEYHKLVVEYHPDNNPDGMTDFLAIQQERERILASMK